MPTKNRDTRHNFNWHQRPANEAIEVIEGVEYIYNPLVVEGPFVHDAYGQRRPTEGEWSADSSEQIGAKLPFLWQGLTTDPAPKLFNNMPRAFDPTTEPFMQQEPLAYADGLNVYLTEADNPIHAANPLGE